MKTAQELACPQCKRRQDEQALVCVLCGHVFRRERAGAAACALPDLAPAATVVRALAADRDDRASAAGPRLEPWLYLGVGLATAPIFAWTPILRYMGWFLASLVHEIGHAAFAWLCGMPAVPAISLGGHAAAVHAAPSVLLALVIAAGLAAATWQALVGRARWIALGALSLMYPAIAFTGARDLLHLLAGHGTELTFAALCFWKALDGGFTEARPERALHATLAWFLLGKNASLCWSLMHSSSARAQYRSNGSFGLTNDYIRVAEDVLSCRLPTVAGGMLVACLLVLPAALVLWRLSTRSRSASRT